jgi:hypothetical protein
MVALGVAPGGCAGSNSLPQFFPALVCVMQICLKCACGLRTGEIRAEDFASLGAGSCSQLGKKLGPGTVMFKAPPGSIVRARFQEIPLPYRNVSAPLLMWCHVGSIKGPKSGIQC